MTSIGILYPGHSAEDDDGWAQEHLRGHGHDVALALVHTSVGEDAHRVDALLDLGGADRLAAGADQLPPGCAALVRTCTSGSDRTGADAVLLPDTALHALRWVEDLESALGTVVLIADPVPAGGDAALLGAAR